MAVSSKSVTEMLVEWSQGHDEVLGELMPVVYGELKRLASRYLRRERPDHTLQATALVHEAYLQLVDQRKVPWRSRAHFIGLAAQLMRRILVEHARRHQASKRGGAVEKLALDEAVRLPMKGELDLVELDEALTALSTLDPQQGRIVELRFFGGLTMEETAEALNLSTRTVYREWHMAKAWLLNALEERQLP
jgi:RNA polymerase sigma factor (TIGR02999 family)